MPRKDNAPRILKADKLLQICWLIANAEAKSLGAIEILPIHFLLAVLKIVDPQFPGQLDKLDVASEEWAKMCRAAQDVRGYIEVLPERVTQKRRRLRARLAEKQVNPPITAEGLLHRSESLKRAFHDALLFAEGDALTLLGVVQSLFELEIVTLRDIDNKSWSPK